MPIRHPVWDSWLKLGCIRMASKRVLFYLEPVVFRDSPLSLQGWLQFFAAFADRSRSKFTSSLAASNLIARIGSSFSTVFEINSAQLLIDKDFDRSAYARDICFGEGFSNTYLLNALCSIRDELNPDIVISVSDNRYLKEVFKDAAVMFMELGPLPRLGTKLAAYVDPFGHQVGSALSQIAGNPWCDKDLSAFLSIWNETWGAAAVADAEQSGMRAWLDEAAGGRKILLAALQPRDWITYEGIGPTIDPVAITRLLASRVESDWIVVPQWHVADMVPAEALIEDLGIQQRNIVVPPAHLRIARSESMLPFVDAVATVSSNVAFAAAIIGKPVSVLGKSSSAPLSRPVTQHVAPRPDLLAFMVCGYCAPLAEWMGAELSFARHVEALVEDPGQLLRGDVLDPRRIYEFLEGAPSAVDSHGGSSSPAPCLARRQ